MLDELVRMYLGLRDAWRAALNVRECADDAPWRWLSEQPDDAPITPADMLIMAAQESGMPALAAVGGRYIEFARAGSGERLRLTEPFVIDVDLAELVCRTQPG